MQLLRKSCSELKLLEAVSLPQNEDLLQNDSDLEASGQAATGRQQELIEKVLKNVAVASEVLETLFIPELLRFYRLSTSVTICCLHLGKGIL